MRSKVRILFYSGHCDIVGGDAKYILELVSNLDQQKFEFELFTDTNHMFEKRACQWLTKDIPVHYLDTFPRSFQPTFFERCREIVKKGKDINFLHGLLYSLLSKSVAGISIERIVDKLYRLLTFNDLREFIHNICVFRAVFKGRKNQIDIFHFNNGGYPGKRAGLVALVLANFYGVKHTIMSIQNLPGRKRKLSLADQLTDLAVKKYCHHIISPAEKVKRFMGSNRCYPTGQIETIYHGLMDVQPLTPEEINAKKSELGVSPDIPLILITAHIDEDRKGHMVLINSLLIARKKYPELVLLIVGDGSKRSFLEAKVKELQLENNVRFLGYRQDLIAINSIIDVAINPSIIYEGMPYSIREAMRCGRPVITTDAGGCDEAVIDGVNGIIVRQNDPQDLANAIIRLLGERDLLNTMGKMGKKLFLEKFLLENEINQHELLYRTLMGNRPA